MEEKNIKQIDFIEIFWTIWSQKKKYFIVLPSVLIFTYLLTVSVPRYYNCTVSLAPESSGSSSGGSLNALASSFGISTGLAKLNSEDALYAEIYPEIISSDDFIAGLMTVNIKNELGDIKCNYYTYLRDKQNRAWWSKTLGFIVNIFTKREPDQYNGTGKISTFHLTKSQRDIFELAKRNISCMVDKKTDIISISVTDQDPLICATMADATCRKLQEFITNYRTNKARIDYNYYNKLRIESKENYVRARQTYTSFVDANQDVQLASYKAKQEDLENEMQLKYNMYTAMDAQTQSAVAKLQEATPAFTIIQSASVPTKPAGPKRLLTALIMSVVAFFILTAWILFVSKTIKKQ